jgi:YfiH family protein
MALNPVHSGAISFSFPGLAHIKCVFTTREAGNISLVNHNGEDADAALSARERFFASLGVDSWSELKQVHGDALVINPDPTAVGTASLTEADGHATDRKHYALMVKTADCQPILLAHPDGYVGAVHAGWRGNVLEFPRTAVARFCEQYGLDPADVRAVRGPSLGYAEFVNFSREWPSSFAPWFDRATKCVDLWSLTRRQLRDAGLKNGNIYGIDFCTYSQNESFFSHRRGDAGRQAGIIWRV